MSFCDYDRKKAQGDLELLEESSPESSVWTPPGSANPEVHRLERLVESQSKQLADSQEKVRLLERELHASQAKIAEACELDSRRIGDIASLRAQLFTLEEAKQAELARKDSIIAEMEQKLAVAEQALLGDNAQIERQPGSEYEEQAAKSSPNSARSDFHGKQPSSSYAQVICITELLQRCDLDRSGTISYHELYILCNAVLGSQSTMQIDKMINMLGANRLHQIPYKDITGTAMAGLLFNRLVVDHGIDQVTDTFSGNTAEDVMMVKQLSPLFEGVLSKVRAANEKFKLRLEQMKEVFRTIDTSGDDVVEKEELLAFGKNLHKGNWDEDRQAAFWNAIDTDGDGCITIWEFLDFYRHVIYDLSDDKFDRGRRDFLRAQVKPRSTSPSNTTSSPNRY